MVFALYNFQKNSLKKKTNTKKHHRMKKSLFFLILLANIFIFGQAPTNGLIAYYGFESNINSHDSQNNFTARSNTTATIY